MKNYFSKSKDEILKEFDSNEKGLSTGQVETSIENMDITSLMKKRN